VLDIAQTHVTDAGLAHLKPLAKLAYLDISGTGVTDAGVEHLLSLKGLQVLNVSDVVTAKARERLRQALPNLKFDGRPEDVLSNRR
jgi:hypothetical protein